MAAAYGVALHKGKQLALIKIPEDGSVSLLVGFLSSPTPTPTAITAGKLKCNFKGVVLGDSWISPIDYVMSWAPYLYATSLIDDEGYAAINKAALATKKVSNFVLFLKM